MFKGQPMSQGKVILKSQYQDTSGNMPGDKVKTFLHSQAKR